MPKRQLTLPILTLTLVLAAAAAPAASHWTVILKEPPAASRYHGRTAATRLAAEPYRQHLIQSQESLRSQLQGMHVTVNHSVQRVLNAMFVTATPAQVAALRKLPEVKAVVAQRWYHKADQLTMSNVQSAWNTAGVGGQSNAGAGLKIGIIDTGIDETNPSFQDKSLTAPAGYPICDVSSNCAFTSNKVIVARSYVSDIIFEDVINSADPAAQSRPDDLSARDMDGHGSAVSSVAAGVPASFNGINMSGVAPKAFLGNYKVFGSDEINGGAPDNGIISALDDAVSDGMDIINLSLGGPPFGGPLDSGETCGLPAGEACDPLAAAIEQVVQAGVVVVCAAGNDGADGYQFNLGDGSPTFGTIASPGYTPSAISAGGIENDITYLQSVQISGTGVPSDIARVAATISADGPFPLSPDPAFLVDVTQFGDSDGLLCNALSGTPLNYYFALVERGSCDFSVKVANAQAAGAIGVVFIDNGTGIAGWTAGPNATIPSFLVDQSSGAMIKSYVDGTTGVQATLNPDPFQQVPAATLGYLANSVAYFASRGPVTGDSALKPDVSAAATDFLLAAENYDPNGELFGFNRYAAADGTSFSTPMLAGAAALVLQAHPGLAPLQVRSMLVNTASLSGLTTSDGSAAASLAEVGSGILQAQNAVVSTVQFDPSTVSFGLLSAGSALPAIPAVAVSNIGGASVTLQLTVTEPSGVSGTSVLVNGNTTASVTVGAGSTASVNVSLSGSVPSPGRYEGVITATGGPTTLYIPYMFLVGDGVPYDIIPINGVPPGYSSFDGPVGAQIPCIDQSNCLNDYGTLGIRVIDQFGAPVQNYPIAWTTTGGNGTVEQGDQYTSTTTDQNGLGFATVILGSTPGSQEFTATVNGMSIPFDGNARLLPAINANGIVDSASGSGGRAVAPGSWISIYGQNMSDYSDNAFDGCPICSTLTQPVPLGIDGVAFSFDAPAAGISLPGHVNYVSPNQLNVLVPWGVAGQSSVTVKVILNYTYSGEYSLPIATYSPGFFQIDLTTHQVAALDQNYAVISPSNAVARGGLAQIYMNGLGPVSNTPADGAGASSTNLSQTPAKPTITIGGQNATVGFSGLAPDFASLYQVNVTVPNNISTGQQTITCTIGGVSCANGVITVK